ncbi:hypothetical protein E2K80_07335 [Rhodophyticola sp. CCM32]|uniref:hypothetical protein n=1 Tax=Rhodophyticola sp. CCM32 TaxID=2916397 RepID=UPI00107F49BE|nr:hypothetical protein [Rhodophyticola sp. CCM32]QBY00575.1 hypothetical protein E2K80_07335 [Rhodophyticola sp. CCM32]
MIRPFLCVSLIALSGCITYQTGPIRTSTTYRTLPANPAPAAIVDGVPVTLTDGSRGLALWCSTPGDCIANARSACNNSQSIRSVADIDNASPRAAEFFERLDTEPSSLVVACS